MPMNGIKDLQSLLNRLSPTIHKKQFCFVCINGAKYGEHSHLCPLASFEEAEGLTLVIPRDIARASGYADAPAFSCITLNVHSSLAAVGLTAAVSGQLADAGISVNMIAGYYHDHLFIPEADSTRALLIVQQMTAC